VPELGEKHVDPPGGGCQAHRHRVSWIPAWAEDRALLGSNLSAAVNSNTAGLGGASRPGRPPAGSTAMRKIPGVRGQSPRVVPQSNQNRNPWQKCVSIFNQPAFHAEPVQSWMRSRMN
jgi:hypothetical protein